VVAADRAVLPAGRLDRLAGRRPSRERRPAELAARARGAEFPEYDRPGRAAAAKPEDDEEFLRKVRERAEEQRRRYRESQRDEDPGATA
jgi:hypothetical protein